MITRSFALVPDPRGERLLLVQGDGGWEIPHVETTEAGGWHVVEDVNQGFSELLALELTTLRSVENREVDDELRLRFYEVELHGSPAAPRGTDWHTRADVERVELAEPDHRAVLLRCLDERDEDGGALRIPWARPGWFAPAVTWIREQLGGLGHEVTDVVQERAWSISTVLRASTSDGNFFFKAVAPVFASEPRMTRELGRRHPGLVPELAAIDEERGWMLMRDLGGDSLSTSASATHTSKAGANSARPTA